MSQSPTIYDDYYDRRSYNRIIIVTIDDLNRSRAQYDNIKGVPVILTEL
jgi:hypothetical protein